MKNFSRITPECPYFGKCGGCDWQDIPYEIQLKWKEEKLSQILQKKVLPIIPSPKIFGWRSRITVHTDETGKVGFFAAGTQRVVDIEACLIAEEEVNQQLKKLRGANKKEKKDYELRSTDDKGFTQVNRLQNENLTRLVREWAGKLPHDYIVELFCGHGNLTKVLIPLAKKIIAIDSDREAITSAPTSSAQFICTDAIRFFSQKLEFPVDLLVIDPPRDGAAGVVEGVLKNRPKNILYISCHPATLARDIKFLKEFASYALVQSQPIDMFPHSHHIESLNWIAPAGPLPL